MRVLLRVSHQFERSPFSHHRTGRQLQGGLPLLLFDEDPPGLLEATQRATQSAEEDEKNQGTSAAGGAGAGEDLLKTATEEHVLARLLTELMHAYVERDDPERAFWCSSSLSALDAACLQLSGSSRLSSGDATL